MRELVVGVAVTALVTGCPRAPEPEKVPLARSGTRLRAQFLRGDEAPRAERFASFYDGELDLACEPGRLVDGGLACLPRGLRGYGETVWADPACTVPGVAVDAYRLCDGCDEGFASYVVEDDCRAPHAVSAVVRLGPEVPTERVAFLLNGECVTGVAPRTHRYFPAEPIPLDAFATFSVAYGGTAQLTMRKAISPDGAETLLQPEVEGRSEARVERTCGGERRWLPIVGGQLSPLFGDAACSVITATSCHAKATFAGGEVSACDGGSSARFRLAEPVTQAYSSGGGTVACAAASVGGAPGLRIADLVAEESFPPATELSFGTGRLVLSGWSDARGSEVLSPDLTFFDRVFGLPCELTRTPDAGLRCVPRGRADAWPIAYLDPACQAPALEPGGVHPDAGTVFLATPYLPFNAEARWYRAEPPLRAPVLYHRIDGCYPSGLDVSEPVLPLRILQDEDFAALTLRRE